MNEIINSNQKVEYGIIEDNPTASGVVNSGVTNSGVMSPIQRPIAYTIKDKYFGEFQVIESANAWWMDPIKVNDLIKAFKANYKVEEAIVFAGISRGQWEYFLKVHPEFSGVKDRCKRLQFMRARDTMNGAIDDPNYAKWFLGKYDEPEEKKVEPQVQNVQNNVNITINESNVKSMAREIIAGLGQIAERSRVYDDGSSGEGGSEGDPE